MGHPQSINDGRTPPQHAVLPATAAIPLFRLSIKRRERLRKLSSPVVTHIHKGPSPGRQALPERADGRLVSHRCPVGSQRPKRPKRSVGTTGAAKAGASHSSQRAQARKEKVGSTGSRYRCKVPVQSGPLKMGPSALVVVVVSVGRFLVSSDSEH